ncbi:MAG: Ni/Fe hydrogenase subunit gamma [Nitrososphaeria archaeon]|nr:Ni/Fe hydrogenase subunit gamma [Nitrososphaeria archaeon]NIN53514.1 Ni/Fe hydrogenase subunit gamma [Nitrososphaeria archaeon]NIQ34025.1 Ni/Fe hydrogenase subunit gamma [Nitrososphaeria archaeon]
MNPYIPQKVIIERIKKETYDTNTYMLSFVEDNQRSRFTFTPGQFMMVSLLGVGEAAISLSSMQRKRFELTLRRVGRVTNALFKLQEGDHLWVRGPYGRGWPMSEAKHKDLMLISGGCGCGTIRPVIMLVEAKRKKYGHLEVLYGARTPYDALFRDEYERWSRIPDSNVLLTVDQVPNDTDWKHSVGVITTLFEQIKTTPENSLVLTVGPEVMMKFVAKGLLKRGFTADQLFFSMERRMRCGIGKCGHCQIGSKFTCKDGPVFSYSELSPLPDHILLE